MSVVAPRYATALIPAPVREKTWDRTAHELLRFYAFTGPTKHIVDFQL